MKLLKENRWSLAIFAIMLVVTLYLYPQLPEKIPTKFNSEGNPIQYGSKEFAAFIIPVVYLLMIVLMNFVVRSSPKKFAMPNSRKAFRQLNGAAGLLLLGVHLGALLDPMGKVLFAQCFSLGAALFLILVGNVLGKTEQNFVMGVRVPWTLASEANWRATHRFAGMLMFVAGALLFAISLFYPAMYLTVGMLVITGLIAVAYSYLYYRKYEATSESET